MAYLVVKGESFARSVTLTNTCNKPRLACKIGNGTSYIPISSGGGTKNLRINGSYIDIRQSSTYTTTRTSYRDTISQIYTSTQTNTTSSSLGGTYTTSTKIYGTSSGLHSPNGTGYTATRSRSSNGGIMFTGTLLYRYGASDQYSMTSTFTSFFNYITHNGSGGLYSTASYEGTGIRGIGPYGRDTVTYYSYYSGITRYPCTVYNTITQWADWFHWTNTTGTNTGTTATQTVNYNTTIQSWYYSNKATTTGTTINTTTYSYY